MLAIGLMSGTSLDGIDVALCDVQGMGKNTKITCVDFLVYPIPENTKNKIRNACLSDCFTTRDVCSLNFEIGKLFSQAVKEIKIKNRLDDNDIEFVASHGQTIYHLPNPGSDEVASTLQIGEPAILAFDHKVKVISNFRVMDIAAGGQGAPLVPFSEKILYGKKNKLIALQNIGGIGNVTLIDDFSTIAFDTGPGNMMIDQAMIDLFQKKFDESGKIAASGKNITSLLNELMNHPFLSKLPPKTTGREDFGEQFVLEILKKYSHEKPEDIVNTFTQFTANSIAYNYKVHCKKLPDELIIGGGGAYNKELIKMLKAELPNVVVKTQEDIGFSSDAKEAIAFVILGNETLHCRPSNVCGATGAKYPVILGSITENPFYGAGEINND